MIKVIYLCFVAFAFIITSCYEQTALDDADNDNQSEASYDNVDDNVDNDNQSDSQYGSTDNNNQSEPSCDEELNNNSNNNVKARNKSGSRIIFNEYHLSDGSVIYDNKPFDSLYNRHCDFVDSSNPTYLPIYSGLEGCCVSFNHISEVITAYKDSNCTDEVSLAKISSYLGGQLINSDIAIQYKQNSPTLTDYFCGNVYTYTYIQIEAPINYKVYIKTSDTSHRCLTWDEYAEETKQECYYLASYKELTIDEARSFFVCAE